MIDLDERAAEPATSPCPRKAGRRWQRNLALLAAMAALVEKAAPTDGSEAFVL